MRKTRKHENQEPVIYSDFSAGLNLSTNADGIAINELHESINVEVEQATGRLKTVAGTVDVLNVANEIFAAIYDEINKAVLLVMANKSVHLVNQETGKLTRIGMLTGTVYPKYTAWENGVLIASGGKLQYYNGTTLDTLTDSPQTESVYIRAGRVVVPEGSNLKFSAVGDETNWTDESNDDSSAKFVEVGYKDGGTIIGMCNLYNDILVIKNNRRVYRLLGDYPNWQITEVSRNVECSGRLSYCALVDSAVILGKNELQMLTTMQSYGDVKPSNIATKVTREIQRLPENAKVRFLPPLNQIWIIGNKGEVLTYDLTRGGFFKRKFNSEVVDVATVGDVIFVIKKDRIARLDENTFYDNGEALKWKFEAKRLISQNDYLLKRTQVSIIPLSEKLYSGTIKVGAVRVALPIPARSIQLYQNKSSIYKNRVKVNVKARNQYLYAKGKEIYDNFDFVDGNEEKIFSRPTMLKESRNVYRNKFLSLNGQGSAGGFILNAIILDIAEV